LLLTVSYCGFTHHPDKEGTESVCSRHGGTRACLASHTIPIKRELKGDSELACGCAGCGFTHHPDKEGTESSKLGFYRQIESLASHTIPIKRELKDVSWAG